MVRDKPEYLDGINADNWQPSPMIRMLIDRTNNNKLEEVDRYVYVSPKMAQVLRENGANMNFVEPFIGTPRYIALEGDTMPTDDEIEALKRYLKE